MCAFVRSVAFGKRGGRASSCTAGAAYRLRRRPKRRRRRKVVAGEGFDKLDTIIEGSFDGG